MPGKQYQFRSESIFLFLKKTKMYVLHMIRKIFLCFCQNEQRILTKEINGKILMITGSKGMAGAAYLSAKAAYAVGAGLVQIYTAEENRTVLQELLPEAIISCYNETAGKPDDKELEN